MSNETTCKGCGKKILWGTDGGKHIPLDPSPPVYFYDGVNTAEGLPLVSRERSAYVSHFATCSSANQFSGKARRKASA